MSLLNGFGQRFVLSFKASTFQGSITSALRYFSTSGRVIFRSSVLYGSKADVVNTVGYRVVKNTFRPEIGPCSSYRIDGTDSVCQSDRALGSA